MNSVSMLVSVEGNWVHWTRFLYMETEFNELDFHVSSMSHPLDSHVGTELEIEPARLDFRKWSPALHMFPWVPAEDLFPLCPSYYILDIEHSILSVHFSSSQYTQSSSLHSSHTTFQVYNIVFCYFFFVKKNLEHIRKSYILFYFILLLV